MGRRKPKFVDDSHRQLFEKYLRFLRDMKDASSFGFVEFYGVSEEGAKRTKDKLMRLYPMTETQFAEYVSHYGNDDKEDEHK